MDIKAQIEKIADKIKNDPNLLEKFKKEPVKAVESLLGVDLPDDVIEKIALGVKTKISGDKISGALGSIKNCSDTLPVYFNSAGTIHICRRCLYIYIKISLTDDSIEHYTECII